jgi:hypothetical protein
MMNDKLEWTQRLGDAFLADEAGVMRTVQGLRQRAQQAGNLQSTEQQRVYVQERHIIIEPAQPQYVYVPVYNPTVIYGTWWAPAYVPWYWYPPAIWGYPPAPAWWGYRAGYYWGSGWAVHTSYWGWARPNWATNNVNVNININNNYWASRPQYRDRYPNGTGTWQHVPEHRKGVAYRDAATYNRYRPTNQQAVQTREGYRGNTTRAPTVQSGGTGAAMMQPGSTGAPTNRATQGAAAQPATGQANQGYGQANARRGTAGGTPQGSGAALMQPNAGSTGAPDQGARGARDRTARSAQGGSPPQAQAQTWPAQTFQTQPRPQVQMESNRGQASRQQMNVAPAQGAGQQVNQQQFDANRARQQNWQQNQNWQNSQGQGNRSQGNPQPDANRGQAGRQQGNAAHGEKHQGNPADGGQQGKSR